MPRFKLLVTVACFSLLTASPALAQHMIDDAGTFPFNDPMRDLGFASSRPSANAMAMVPSDRRMKQRTLMTNGAQHRK